MKKIVGKFLRFCFTMLMMALALFTFFGMFYALGVVIKSISVGLFVTYVITCSVLAIMLLAIFANVEAAGEVVVDGFSKSCRAIANYISGNE